MLTPTARPMGPDAGGQWVRRWTSLEWAETVDGWVVDRLAERGVAVVGAPVTYRARFWSVVRCYPTDAGLVWFKETNPGHRFEARLTQTVSALAPDQVVVPIATERSRGWLLTHDHGDTMSHADIADQRVRTVVVRAIADLQCALYGRIDRAEHVGMAVVPPASAGDQIHAVARQWAGLSPDHPLHCEGLELERIESACDSLALHTAPLADATITTDLDLNDVYAANICLSRPDNTLLLRFFDFGNAVWGHLFVTLHGFVDSVEEWNNEPLTPADRSVLHDAYLDVWRRHLDADEEKLRQHLAAADALVHVHKLVAWLCLVPHADEHELRTRGEIPRKWMGRIADLLA